MSTYQNRTIAAFAGLLSIASIVSSQTVKPVGSHDDEDIVAQSFEAAPTAVLKATPPQKQDLVVTVPAIEISKQAETAKPAAPAPAAVVAETKPAPISTPAPAKPSPAPAVAGEDIGMKTAAAPVTSETRPLLQKDPSAQPLPAAKPFAKAAPTYKWENVPLAQALDEVARANGLTVQVILPEGASPKVTADLGNQSPRNVVRALALQCGLAVSERNGAFTITARPVLPVAEAKPVLNTRDFNVPPELSSDFNAAFAKSREVGRLTLLGSDSKGGLMVRVTDTPTGLDALSRAFADSQIKMVAPAPVKPLVIDVKIESERKKLVEKRERLLNSYVAESR